MSLKREMHTERDDEVLIVANIPFAITGDYGDTLVMLTENNDDQSCAVFDKTELLRFIVLLTERYNEIV